MSESRAPKNWCWISCFSFPLLLAVMSCLGCNDRPHLLMELGAGTARGPQDDDTGDDDSAGSDVPEECSLDHLPSVSTCPWGNDVYKWEGTETGTGYFEDWGFDGTRTFKVENGDALEIWMWGSEDGWASIPDLELLGPVGLTIAGRCGLEEVGFSLSFHVWCPEDPDNLILLMGTIPVADASGWTIYLDPIEPDCPQYPCDCWEYCTRRRVVFEHGDESVALLQGQEAQVGNYLVRVNDAVGVWGSTNCADYGGGGFSYQVVPVSMNPNDVCGGLEQIEGCGCTVSPSWSHSPLAVVLAGLLWLKRRRER